LLTRLASFLVRRFSGRLALLFRLIRVPQEGRQSHKPTRSKSQATILLQIGTSQQPSGMCQIPHVSIHYALAKYAMPYPSLVCGIEVNAAEKKATYRG
jgi:hypothetical protein